MKLLLVLGDDSSNDLLLHYIKPLGFDFIHYTHALKAMDNIDEIDPQAIIISAKDFPRHWKTMVQFFRSERSKEACPIIILKGAHFPVEEASKASYLGISGIVSETLDNPAEIERLQGILGRYILVDEKRQAPRLHTESWQRFGFAFARPNDNVLVTGEVKDVSTGGLSFLPDNQSLLGDLTLHTEIEDCSLRAGDTILSPICRLTRTGRIISLEFISFPYEEQETLNTYLENLPLQELKNAQKQQAEASA